MSPRNSEPTTDASPPTADDAPADDRGDEPIPPWPERGPEIAAETDAADDDVDTDTSAVDDPEADVSESTPEREPIALPGPDPAPEPEPLEAGDPPDTELALHEEPEAGIVIVDVELDQQDQPEAEPEPEAVVATEVLPLLTDVGGWEKRWTAIQTAFVDDPGLSIEQADRLVTEAVEDLAKILHGHRTTLQAQWRQGDQPADTEQLRVTLQGYRTLLFELLAM